MRNNRLSKKDKVSIAFALVGIVIMCLGILSIDDITNLIQPICLLVCGAVLSGIGVLIYER